MQKKIKLDSFRLSAYIFSIIFGLLILFPLIFMISNAVKDDISTYDMPPSIIPKPPKSVSIIADYSEIADQDEKVILDNIKRDSALAMLSVVYEMDRDSIGEVEFYGKIGDKTVYYSRAHRAKIKLELDFGEYAGVSIDKNTVSYLDKYKKFVDSVGYKSNFNGLEVNNTNKNIDNNIKSQIKEFFLDKHKINGSIQDIFIGEKSILMLENFKYYLISPSYIYKSDEFIKKYSFFAFFFNTIFGLVFVLISQIGLCSLTAYSLSKLFDRRLSNFLLMLFLATLMIPFISIFVPQLKLLQSMGIKQGYLAMFFPHLCPSAFFIFIFKGFFDQLPTNLLEAARIDGASEWYTFIKICLPLSKSIIMVVAMNVFIQEWGNFFWYFIVANDTPKYWTINLAIYELSQVPTMKQNILMGISVVTILPIIILTLILSNKIKESVVSSGIKG